MPMFEVGRLVTNTSPPSGAYTPSQIAQEQTVFAGAAVCALVAAVLALVLFRTAETRALPSRPWVDP